MDPNERDHFAGLIKAVADERDQIAFTHLFDHFAPRLKSWLVKRAMRPDEAEELVQDVMTVLWHRAHLYDPRRSSLVTEIPGADIAVEKEEDAARLRAALLQIPEEQMQLVRAAFFLGHSHSQIASTTGLPLGTVKSRIRLAFERLRKALDESPS